MKVYYNDCHTAVSCQMSSHLNQWLMSYWPEKFKYFLLLNNRTNQRYMIRANSGPTFEMFLCEKTSKAQHQFLH